MYTCVHNIYDAVIFSFRAEGEFWTHSPVPQVKFHLKTISKGFMHDDKLIAKVKEIISFSLI